MKQLIIDKIDRLVEKGYQVEETNSGYSIDKIHCSKDSEYFPFFTVNDLDLESDHSAEIYFYLESIHEKQFIEYLKGD